MTALRKFTLRRAIALVTPRFVGTQLGLTLLVFLLFAAWTRIPDANIAYVLLSALFGILILGVAFIGEAAILIHLRSFPRSRRALLRGAAILFIAALLWMAWSMLLEHLSLDDAARAGYINSRFSHGMRNTFSYPHLLRWFGWFWTLLQWLGTGILLVAAVASTCSKQPGHGILHVLRSGVYWTAFLLCAILTTTISNALINWTPGQGLAIESMSLILRLGFILLLDTALICFVLAIIVALLELADFGYAMLAGTPELSHPRTTDIP